MVVAAEFRFTRRVKNLRTGLLATLLGVVACGGAGTRNTSPVAAPTESAQAAPPDLIDPVNQAKAVDEFMASAAAALKEDRGDHAGAHYRAVVDRMIEPLVGVCTDDAMTGETRPRIIRLLVDANDDRAAPCLAKILAEWRQGHVEWLDSEAQGILRALSGRTAASNVAKRVPALADSVIGAFTRLRYADAQTGDLFRDVQAAALAAASSAHVKTMLELVGRPLPSASSEAKPDPKAFADAVFTQVVAATILGNLKEQRAIRPLLAILLSPSKSASPIAPAAIAALARIGPPVIPVAAALARRAPEVEPLITSAQAERVALGLGEHDLDPAENAHVAVAADVLAAVGTIGATDAVIDALATADAEGKALLALALPRLPASARSIDAYKGAFDAIPIEAILVDGSLARQRMLSATSGFHDATLVPWLVSRATAKEVAVTTDFLAVDVEDYQRGALEAAVTLMTLDQIPLVKKLYDAPSADRKTPLGKPYEDVFNYARFILEECEGDVQCYVGKVADPKYHEDPPTPKEGEPGMPERGKPHETWNRSNRENLIAAVKACAMIAILATPDVKSKLLDALPSVENPRLASAILAVIVHLSPQGDKDVVARLEARVDELEAAKRDIEAGGLRPVIVKLEARVE